MSDIDAPPSPYRQLDDTLRDWMRQVMRERQWSAEQWARQAGIAGTTITRYLYAPAPDAKPRRRPNSLTVEKLAAAAGAPFTYRQENNVPDIDDDEPEVFRLHAALGVAILALELIADENGDKQHAMARAALNHLHRRHPVSREHMSRRDDDTGRET